MATAPLTPLLAAFRAALNSDQQTALDAALAERQAAARATRRAKDDATAAQIASLQSQLAAKQQHLDQKTDAYALLETNTKELLAQAKAANDAKLALDPRFAANAQGIADLFSKFVADINAKFTERAALDAQFDDIAARHVALTAAGQQIADLPEKLRIAAQLQAQADALAVKLASARAAAQVPDPVSAQ